MPRIRIPGPDIEAYVTAEQVAAYLLARGWRGPVHRVSIPVIHFWIWRDKRQFTAELPSRGEATRKQLHAAVLDIARAERRHPSAVLADIIGPVRGDAGVGCGGTADECSKPHGTANRPTTLPASVAPHPMGRRLRA